MSPGLLAAQACHLNDEWLRARILESKANRNCVKGESKTVNFNLPEFQWLEGPVLSILAVNTPEELEVLKKRAKDVGVAFREWHDTIPSQIFPKVFLQTFVGIAFGPDDDEKVKQVVGDLPLF